MCAVIKRTLDCGQNFTFTLAEKILQMIVIENRTGRLAKENKKNGQAVFPILSVKFVIFLCGLRRLLLGDCGHLMTEFPEHL